MMEGLGRLLKAKSQNHQLKGLSPHPSLEPQTHQQFVDDTMLMGNSSVQEAKTLKTSLNTFLLASGLDINKEKSHIYFFNTCQITKQNILCILEFTEGSLPAKYLGSPLTISIT